MSDETTSIEQAGGCAVGMTGKINCYNADAEARFCKALVQVGRWVESEAGCLLGHIKAAIVLDDGSGITLNLTDLESGVERHGTLEPHEKVNFSFMCAVLDVDEHELKHRMFHAIDDSGIDYELDEHVECNCHCHDHEHGHHHHHDGGCHCHDHGHDHGHEHGHHHHHDGECHCHDHDCHDHDHHHHHDGECHCHDHEHGHHHHHDDGHDHGHGECHCAECEAKRQGKDTKEKKGSFLDKILRRNKK